MRYRLPRGVLDDTFEHFRVCGDGRRECQALWVGPWAHPDVVERVVHPAHTASAVGFQLDSAWLNRFWLDLAGTGSGVRVQVHTHPGAAYHSGTDDAFPLIHSTGFLSLVIPRFGQGPIGFDEAYLTEIEADGGWRQVPISDRLEVA